VFVAGVTEKVDVMKFGLNGSSHLQKNIIKQTVPRFYNMCFVFCVHKNLLKTFENTLKTKSLKTQ